MTHTAKVTDENPNEEPTASVTFFNLVELVLTKQTPFMITLHSFKIIAENSVLYQKTL